MKEDYSAEVDSIAALAALGRLLAVAMRDTGQSRRVASFLLSWHNAEENGGWNPVELWQLDSSLSADVLLVLRFVAQEHKYPDDLRFAPEIAEVWRRWRGAVQ